MEINQDERSIRALLDHNTRTVSFTKFVICIGNRMISSAIWNK